MSIFGFEVILFAVSVLAGGFGAILGIGGGIFIVPLLTLGFGINIHYAIGASIVTVIATSSGAAAAFVRDRIANIRVAIFLEMATTAGAIVGFLLSSHVRTRWLFLLFAVLLLYSAFVMFKKRGRDEQVAGSLPGPGPWMRRLRMDSSYPDAALGREIGYRVHNLPFGFVLMGIAGVVSGLLGIGSGILKVPAMDSVMRLPIKVSSATSNFMIGVTAAASATAYYLQGDVLPAIAAPVVVGVFLGSIAGARVMMRLPSSRIRVAFALVLVVTAVQMGIKAMVGGG